MARSKPNQVRPDGRSSNGRKKGTIVKKQPPMTPAKMNKAKKNRLSIYSVNSIINEFGSEQEFTDFLAKQSRTSFNHLKQLMEYAYGKAEHQERHVEKKETPSIVFINQSQSKKDNNEETIDITYENE